MTGKKKAEKADADVEDQKEQDVDPIVSTAIGKQLKRLYDEVAEEPVPDRFEDLLKQLEEQEQSEK